MTGSIRKSSIEEVYNFVRCEKSDGSAYGTSGKCRKGLEKEKIQRTPQEMGFDEIHEEVSNFKKKFPKDFLFLQQECFRILSNNLPINEPGFSKSTRNLAQERRTTRIRSLLPRYMALLLDKAV